MTSYQVLLYEEKSRGIVLLKIVILAIEMTN